MDRDLKALLDTAVCLEPPLTIDPVAVLVEGRRRLRGRRLLTMGGVALSVVAVVVAAMLVAPQPADLQTAAQGSREKQLSAAFRLGDFLPDGLLVTHSGTTRPDQFVRSDNAYELHAKLADPMGTATIAIGVTLPQLWTADCERYHPYRCDVGVLPDGSMMVSYQREEPFGVFEFLVVRQAGDHIVSVRLSTRGVDDAATRPKPPLSVDQLIGIASSPALSQ